jgi:hypothetical protein
VRSSATARQIIWRRHNQHGEVHADMGFARFALSASIADGLAA